MKILKKLWEYIKYPRIWGAAIVAVLLIAAVAETVIFINFEKSGTEYGAAAYVLYFVSAVLLGYFIYCLVYLIPRAKISVKNWANKRVFTLKLMGQYGFRTIVFATVAFVISIGNAVINGVTGIVSRSLWFVALGVYYLLLSVMRGSVLIMHGKNRKDGENSAENYLRELKAYLFCGVGLVILPIVLSATIWEIVGSDMAFVRSGYMIYFSAAYTFYKIISSVRNTVKARKNDEMSVRAVRNINLADAAVSILALQTAMFHEFSPDADLGYANAIMGAVVCALTAFVGVAMLIIGGKKFKAAKTERQDISKEEKQEISGNERQG